MLLCTIILRPPQFQPHPPHPQGLGLNIQAPSGIPAPKLSNEGAKTAPAPGCAMTARGSYCGTKTISGLAGWMTTTCVLPRLYADWAFGAERTRLHRERAQIKADATNFCRYIRAKILAEPVRQH